MAQASLSYYEKVLKSKVERVGLYPAQDAGIFDQGDEDRNLLRPVSYTHLTLQTT